MTGGVSPGPTREMLWSRALWHSPFSCVGATRSAWLQLRPLRPFCWQVQGVSWGYSLATQQAKKLLVATQVPLQAIPHGQDTLFAHPKNAPTQTRGIAVLGQPPPTLPLISPESRSPPLEQDACPAEPQLWLRSAEQGHSHLCLG